MISKFKPLEIYDLNLPDIPKRSRLYNLEPIGISTPDVESLTGYIARLAQTHCMSTGQLICREVMPILKPEYVSGITDIYINFLSEEQSRAYNGTGLMASNVVNAFYTLTGCNQLQFLTLLAFREVLYPKDLFRTFKAWCPICYQQWQMKGQVLFEPLIWSFNQVTICHHHLQLLQTNCPHCQKRMYFIEWNSRPGYCSKCGAWLGTPLTSETQGLPEKEIESQLWIIRNIGKLIETVPSLSSTPKREIIAKSINDYINQLTPANQTAFAQICGISHGGLIKWITGKSIPTLTKALQICSCLNIELIDFLNGQICELSHDIIVSLLTSHQQSKIRQYEEKPKRKPLGLRKIKQELLKALKEYPPKSVTDIRKRLGLKANSTFYYYFPEISRQISANYALYRKNDKHQQIENALFSQNYQNEYPPSSLTEVSKRIGIGIRALYEHFPEKCYEIAEKYTNYKHESALQKREEIRQQVRFAALKLHNQSIKPTSAKINQFLNNPGCMFNKTAQITLSEILHELGYK
jgi:transcriptional regulator with XRE-family HTH domain